MENPQDKTSASGGGDGDQLIDQAAIDALLGGGGEQAASQPSSGEPPAQAESTGSVSQADIEALLQAAGSSGVNHPEAAGSPPDTDPADEEVRLDTLGRPFDEAAAMMQEAIEEEQRAAEASPRPAAVDARKFEYPRLKGSLPEGVDAKRVTMLNDVNLRVKIQLGTTRMLVEDVLKLGEGSVVELDKLAGDPVDVLVNDRLVARGEVLVLNDSFCVRVSEILSRDPHRITV